jgi:tRNA (mo5U34)-methyltransferase
VVDFTNPIARKLLVTKRGMNRMENLSASLPMPPSNFSEEVFFKDNYWHQRWEVFQGVFTPGNNPVGDLCKYIQLPADLAGKRVLDIGAWNGCFSFECERRGASEVVAYSLENPEETGFNKLKDLLNSKVSYVQGSVYNLSPDTLGTFDLVLFLGVLYHLRYPLLAIDRLRSVTRQTVLIETHVVNNRRLLRKPYANIGRFLPLSLLFNSTPIWRQYREFELHPQDQSNWFGPNIKAVTESFETAGFDIVYQSLWAADRAVFRAEAKAELPARFTETYEGLAVAEGLSPAHTGGLD